MTTLTFNNETHTYLAEGTKVPSVSEVLRHAGLIDLDWVSEEALKRGSYVHQAIEFYLQGELDEEALDEKLAGYLAAWKACEREMGLQVVRDTDGKPKVEQRVYHPIYRYAGTFDVLATLGGRKLVIDLKSGSPSSWHSVQLCGYSMTFTEELVGRANVYLSPDGKYKFIEHKDRNDFNVWKAALTIAQWRMAAGLIK